VPWRDVPDSRAVRDELSIPQIALKSLLALSLAALFCVCIYRAATQPITVDEAHTYKLYIKDQPVWKTFTHQFDPGNHVLQTVLTYAAAKRFGISEFSLRSPSLVACAFYFAGAWLLAFHLIRRLWLSILALGLLVLNPLALDHFCLARGYGIALSCFVWSVYFSWKYLHTPSRKSAVAAGLLLGASVAANLTFLLPAAGLALSFLTQAFRRPGTLHYCLSGLAIVGLFLAGPLSTSHSADFYYGTQTVQASLRDLTETALLYDGNAPRFASLTDFYRIGLLFIEDFVLGPLFVLTVLISLRSSSTGLRGLQFARDRGPSRLRCVGVARRADPPWCRGWRPRRGPAPFDCRRH
jgi:hypothetical protein